jgi:exonuclease VII large subunit
MGWHLYIIINKETFMFKRKQQELDEVVERVLNSMQNSCSEASKRVDKLEISHSSALERIAHLEEAGVAASQRMDRIEAIIESNADSIKELNIATSKLFNLMNLSQQNFEVIQQNFEIIISQVKGIQAENRHIINHLFGLQE